VATHSRRLHLLSMKDISLLTTEFPFQQIIHLYLCTA